MPDGGAATGIEDAVDRGAGPADTIHESGPARLDPGSQTDWQRIRIGRGLQLGRALEAGAYVLEVTVADMTAKRRTAAQWVDFEVENDGR